jgi:hypothetical protein
MSLLQEEALKALKLVKADLDATKRVKQQVKVYAFRLGRPRALYLFLRKP